MGIRLITLLIANYMAYVAGSVIVMWIYAHFDTTTLMTELIQEGFAVIFIAYPTIIFLFSLLLWGVPLLPELATLLYLRSGKASHLYITTLCVTGKSVILLWMLIEGGKSV